MNNEEKWFDTYYEIKKYRDSYKIIPFIKSEDRYVRYMGHWFYNQIRNKKIRHEWKQFMNDPKYVIHPQK